MDAKRKLACSDWDTFSRVNAAADCTTTSLAFMDDLERIPVRVEYITGIVSRIVFQSCAGRNIVSGASGDCGLVEFINLILISAIKSQ
jgi:hypothetical protein